MKKTIKLIPAALALLALASCSNDELLGEKTIEVSSQYQLAVEAEDCNEVGTRAGHVIIGKAREVVWQTGDIIRTYDNNLGKFDEYGNTTSTASLESDFGLVGADEPALSSHNYAVFPSKYVNTLGWGKVEDKQVPILTMDIPGTGISLNDNFGNVYTAADGKIYPIGAMHLPMWGPVKEGTETAEKPAVKVSYMSAFLQLNLSAIPATATKLIIYAPNGEPLSGRFEAALDSENPTDAVLKADKTKYVYSNKIEVSIQGTGVAGKSGTIYLPIIAEQQFKNLIVLAIVSSKGQVIKNYGPAYNWTAADATAFGVTSGATVATGTPASWIDTSDPTKYIAKLGGKLMATEGFTLPRKQAVVCDGDFEIAATCAYPSDITNALVTYGSAAKLTIEIDNTGALQCSAANYQVTIPEALKSSDITLNFKKGITFDAVAAAQASDIKFVGECKSLTVNMESTAAITRTTNAKGFDFSGVTGKVVVKSGDAGGTNYGYFKCQNKATSEFEIGANVTTAAAFAAADNGLSPLIISGNYNKDITSAADVTVTGNPSGDIEVTGTANVVFTPETAYDVTGLTITVASGNVTYDNLDLTAPATIEKKKAGSVNLNNGSIALDLTGNDGAVAVSSKGISEITAVNPSAVATASVSFTSVWDADLTDATTLAAFGNITAATNIYTAAQLAAGVGGDATLLTNITSFTKPWKSADLAYGFVGTGYTITGLNAPLFKEIDTTGGNIAVTGVTIANAAIADWTGTAGVGLLAQSTKGANGITVTATSVAGTIASKDESNALYYAGGLIGKANSTGALTVGGVTDASKVSINVTFTNKGRVFGESGRDANAGTIGQVVGSNTNTGTIDIKANTAIISSALDKSKTGLKFQNNRLIDLDTYEIAGWFHGTSNQIGYCNVTTATPKSGNVTIGANTYLATANYAGLTYDATSKTVTGTLYFIEPVDEATAKAGIAAAKGITAADYAPAATPAVDNVTWNYVINTLNSYETSTY